MNNADYWAQRMKNMTDALEDKSYEYVKNLEEQFDRSIAEVEKDIAYWYQRFADNNGIDLAEAKKLLTKGELKELKWSVEEYIKYGEENAINGQWMKELENASARAHISRLDGLKLQLTQQAEKLSHLTEKATESTGKGIYEDCYYRTAFEIQQNLGVGTVMGGIDERRIEKVLSRPWTTDNQTFRDRCWTNKTALVNSVSRELTQMIMRGESPDRTIKAIAKQFDVAKSKAGRLVMTESAFFAQQSQKDCFEELDVEKCKVVAALDKHTCPICGKLDGTIIKMSDYEVGSTAPPFHPWCRCTTAPYFEDMEGIGERYARDVKDGKSFTVPKDMTYEQWKKLQDEKHGLSEAEKDKYLNKNINKGVAKSENSGIIKIAKVQFSPATTIEEAEAYLQQFGVAGEYVKGKIDLDVANTVNKTVAEYVSVFGDKIKLNSIKKWPKRDAEFVAAYSPVFGDVFLYKCGSKTALDRLLKDAIDNHSLGAWSTPAQEHFIRHELGHAVHSGVGRDATKNALTALFNEARSNLSWGKCGGFSWNAYEKAGLSVDDYKADIRAAGDVLSAYGFTSVEEMVAESVAEYMTGKPRDFAIKVVNTLMGW